MSSRIAFGDQMLPRFARILVVDDSLAVRKAVRDMLAQIGFANIDEAADGLEALSLLGRLQYALVISDWCMAPMSGLELLERLRATGRWHKLPFIMITAQKQKKFMEVARDAGATQFLAKPFGAQALAEKIASSLPTRELAGVETPR